MILIRHFEEVLAVRVRLLRRYRSSNLSEELQKKSVREYPRLGSAQEPFVPMKGLSAEKFEVEALKLPAT